MKQTWCAPTIKSLELKMTEAQWHGKASDGVILSEGQISPDGPIITITGVS